MSDTTDKLHQALTEYMLARLESGDPVSPQELREIRTFLADNGVTELKLKVPPAQLTIHEEDMPFLRKVE
jgi:hypothetical protein